MTPETIEPPVAGRRVDAVVSRLRAAIQQRAGEHDAAAFLEAIGELIEHATATEKACEYVAAIIERSHGDNVGFAEADILRRAANRGEFCCLPSVGDRFRLPWRDYAEFEVVELAFDGNVIELAQSDNPKSLATVSKNDWENWMCNTTPCV